MTRSERLAELIRAEQDRWHDETGCRLDGRELNAYFGMSAAEWFADQLDAEGYDLVSAVTS